MRLPLRHLITRGYAAFTVGLLPHTLPDVVALRFVRFAGSFYTRTHRFLVLVCGCYHLLYLDADVVACCPLRFTRCPTFPISSFNGSVAVRYLVPVLRFASIPAVTFFVCCARCYTRTRLPAALLVVPLHAPPLPHTRYRWTPRFPAVDILPFPTPHLFPTAVRLPSRYHTPHLRFTCHCNHLYGPLPTFYGYLWIGWFYAQHLTLRFQYHTQLPLLTTTHTAALHTTAIHYGYRVWLRLLHGSPPTVYCTTHTRCLTRTRLRRSTFTLHGLRTFAGFSVCAGWDVTRRFVQAFFCGLFCAAFAVYLPGS